MTEKEKMLAGELYYAGDIELVRDRERAKKLCKRFNEVEVDEYERKNCVVNKDIPDNVVVGGNPARIIKEL